MAIPMIAALSRLSIKDYIIAGLVTILIVLGTLTFGFKVWGLGIEGWKPKSERLAIELKGLRDQVAEAERQWAATFEAIRKDYEKKAEEADANAEREIREAISDAEQFIARNRVRCGAAISPSDFAARSAEAGSSEGPDRSDQGAQLDESLVAVPEEDVRICTENTVRLLEAQKWANGL